MPDVDGVDVEEFVELPLVDGVGGVELDEPADGVELLVPELDDELGGELDVPEVPTVPLAAPERPAGVVALEDGAVDVPAPEVVEGAVELRVGGVVEVPLLLPELSPQAVMSVSVPRIAPTARKRLSIE